MHDQAVLIEQALAAVMDYKPREPMCPPHRALASTISHAEREGRYVRCLDCGQTIQPKRAVTR